MQLDETLRSISSREQKGDSERFEWKNTSDLDEFKPERWLVPNETGGMDHNSRAAPMQIFGLGIRGCYGRSSVRMSDGPNVGISWTGNISSLNSN